MSQPSPAPPLPQSPALLRPFFNAFAHPTGLLGRFAGVLMARVDADDRWVVDLLDVQPDDRVLDVGCGPGVLIALAAARASRGLVAGVDPSGVMLRQAARRNAAAVREGRVVLRPGTAVALPFPDAHFTKVCSVHSLYFWPSVDEGLREARRVLAPGGRLVLAVRTFQPDAGLLSPSRYGYREDQLAAVEQALRALGYQDVRTQRRAIGREIIAAIHACG